MINNIGTMLGHEAKPVENHCTNQHNYASVASDIQQMKEKIQSHATPTYAIYSPSQKSPWHVKYWCIQNTVILHSHTKDLDDSLDHERR